MPTTDTRIVARNVAPIMGAGRGHIGDSGAPRLVIDDTRRNRTYVEFYSTPDYVNFVGAAAMSLDAENRAKLAYRLLTVLPTNDRTEVVAKAVATFYTPRVEILP